MPGAAAFFDLDKTVVARSSTLAFSRHFYAGGLINRRAVLRSAYAQAVYLASGADHDQMERMRRYLTTLVSGWDVAQVHEIVGERLHALIDPMVYAEAADLIAEHRAAGRDVVIISTASSDVVEPIGRLLGVDRAVGTRLTQRDGRYTGEIEFYAYGPAKAEAMRELAAEHGYDLAASFAYSDSATDLPMLEAVGNPVAVNPDRTLRRRALERGWPVRDFSHPVALQRTWTTRRTAALLGGGVVAAAAGTAAAAALVARRQQR